MANEWRPPICVCEHPCSWWEEYGPYPLAQNFRNKRTAYGSGYDVPGPYLPSYDPKKHDLFVCDG